jgi:hypothetical protein
VIPDDGIDRALADLVGAPIDDFRPALIVRSARRLAHPDVESPQERRLLDQGGLVVEVTFDLEPEPGRWVWRIGIGGEDLPGEDDDLSSGEFVRSDLSWRLIEWRDTRDVSGALAAPRLLRAS